MGSRAKRGRPWSVDETDWGMSVERGDDDSWLNLSLTSRPETCSL